MKESFGWQVVDKGMTVVRTVLALAANKICPGARERRSYEFCRRTYYGVFGGGRW